MDHHEAVHDRADSRLSRFSNLSAFSQCRLKEAQKRFFIIIIFPNFLVIFRLKKSQENLATLIDDNCINQPNLPRSCSIGNLKMNATFSGTEIDIECRTDLDDQLNTTFGEYGSDK